MRSPDFAGIDDEQLCELLFTMEDRLPKEAAEELARRDAVVPYLAQLVMDKQAWLMDLPEWWAVVHSTFIVGHRSGEEAVLPLISALRWSDAFDCDWVTEVLPSMLGRVGPPALPLLTAVTRDATAGWSARDLAMKSLAAVTLHHPESSDHVFRIIGERLMDEGEDHLVRQMAGQVLLDFRRGGYQLPLLKLAKQNESLQGWEDVWPAAFGPDEVEWAFKSNTPEVWHYSEDWMHFYEPGEIQRRQKRWARERMGSGTSPKAGHTGPGGKLVSFFRGSEQPDSNGGRDPEESD